MNDPPYIKTSKEFFEYAQEKSLMSSNLQTNYQNLRRKFSTTHVKNFFLSKIENKDE